jgi:hypothetical protein
MTGKIRSLRCPLIRDGEKGLNYRSFGRIWIGFWDLGFLRVGQRRGVHVNILEIGSRGEEKCFGGI